MAAVRAVVALVVLVVVAGCTSVTPAPSSSASASTPPSDTSYGRLFSQVQPDGSVSKDVALLAFSTAIAPLPDVPTAPGGPPSDFERADGTFAINWIMQYIDQLTPDQRAVVDAALQPSSSAHEVAAARPVADVSGGLGPLIADDPAKPYDDAIASAESIIASRLHRDLSQHIWFDFGEAPPNTNPNVGDTLAFAYTYGLAGPNLVCGVRATSAMTGASQTRINVVMAHEVFHCFQFEVMPGHGRSKGLDWIVEGQAEWAGEDVGGPSGDGAAWWKKYLATPTVALFQRSYDAVGFYEHLAETGTSPWTIFDAMLATPTDSITAFKAAGAVDDNFLDTWASGLFRVDGLPAAWYAHERWNVTGSGPSSDVNPLMNGDSVQIKAAPVTNQDWLDQLQGGRHGADLRGPRSHAHGRPGGARAHGLCLPVHPARCQRMRVP